MVWQPRSGRRSDAGPIQVLVRWASSQSEPSRSRRGVPYATRGILNVDFKGRLSNALQPFLRGFCAHTVGLSRLCGSRRQTATEFGTAVPYHAPVARHLAIYTGSFDPITLGHLDVLARTRGLFDEVILAIGRNPNKEALFTFDERLSLARALVDEMRTNQPEGAHIRVEHYTGLTVDYAKAVGACAIVRGIRNITDLAGECQLAITNRQVAGIETVFIVTGENFAYTSSSLIKQIAALGGSLDSLSTLVPPAVIDALRKKRGDRSNPLGRLAVDGLVE